MTEEELAQLLVELEELLQELDLDFVVNQERVLAAEGVSTSAEDLDRQTGDDLVAPSAFADVLPARTVEGGAALPGARSSFRRPSFKKTDVLIRPLSTRERLAILLDLVEVTTAGTLAMEQLVHVEISETVTFEDPPEAELLGRMGQPWRLASDVDERVNRAAVVVGVVDELRALADIPRGGWLRRDRSDDSGNVWAATKEDR